MRNRLIIADVQNAFQKGRTPIILTQRTQHVNLLADEAKKFCRNVIRLIGSGSAREKRDELERLKAIADDEPFIIVATGKYVGEGFDEPRLDTLFLAAPIGWEGTLQQYAGRLHRARDGKDNVIIYDYVDVHIKMLESMYHKRVSGYSGMGYKAMSESKAEEKTGSIFDSRSFLPVFENDVRNAKIEITIVSPYIRKNRTSQMLRLLSEAQINGVRANVITRPAGNYRLADQPGIIALMNEIRDAGVHIVEKPNIHQKFIVIDRNLIWYGSINLLSYGSAEESVMRFENMEIADELLNMAD
jgi:superfamily II DNA or RNA helicase